MSGSNWLFPVPAIEIVAWGRSAQEMEEAIELKRRTGWELVCKFDQNHILMYRYEAEQHHALLMVRKIEDRL